MNKQSYFRLFSLLIALVPLLFALRWVAAKFPMSSFTTSTEVRYKEPAKVALFCEHYYERHHYDFIRVFVLDFERETLDELRCPPKAGVMWSELVGVDVQGKVVCRVRTKPGDEYYSCNPRTGETLLIAKTNNCKFIENRYLCTSGYDSDGANFTWYDLAEQGHPVHRLTLDSVLDDLVAVPRSDVLYYIAYESAHMQGEMLSEELETESEMTAFSKSTTIPVPSDPAETLVLMQMSEVGPVEIARWPVVGGSGYVTYQVGDGCIGCVSIDLKNINVHDANTGDIRLQISVPPTALGTDNRPRWKMDGSFVSLQDGSGNNLVYNTTTGDVLDMSASWKGSLLGHHDKEYLTLDLQQFPDDWPGNLDIRNTRNGELLHRWPVPDSEVSIGSLPNSNLTFSPNGREITFVTNDGRVIFAEKASGKILRTIQPRYWVPFLSIFVSLAAFAWLIRWIRYSIRAGATFWLDEGIVIGMASLFLYWRIMLSGCYVDHDRLAWQFAANLLLAFGTIVVHQTVGSRLCLNFRSLPIAGFISILFIGMHSILDRRWFVNATITQVFILGCVLFFGFILTNWFFPSNHDNLATEKRPRDYRLTLRQLLLLTAYCALAMAALRWMDLRICFDVMRREGVDIAIYGVVSLVAYYFTYRRGLIWLKSFLAAVIAFAIFLGWVFPELWMAPAPLHIIARWAAVVAQITLATILVALPILMRRK